jgi:hypothetical protein
MNHYSNEHKWMDASLIFKHTCPVGTVDAKARPVNCWLTVLVYKPTWSAPDALSRKTGLVFHYPTSKLHQKQQPTQHNSLLTMVMTSSQNSQLPNFIWLCICRWLPLCHGSVVWPRWGPIWCWCKENLGYQLLVPCLNRRRGWFCILF